MRETAQGHGRQDAREPAEEAAPRLPLAEGARDVPQPATEDGQLRRLASVVRDSNDAITVQDLDGRITAWNRGAQAMYGYTEEEALRMNIRDTVPDDRREQALDLLRQAETGRVVASLETQRRTKDGRILDVWLTTTKLLDERGRIVAIATTERDITRRKKEEGGLRRLASILLDSNDAITVQDLEGRFEAWNRGAERMYGYTEAEALRMDTDQLVPGAERARAAELVRQIRSGEPVESLELQRVTKDGRTLDVWLTITKLVDDDQKVVGFATTERDITRRKKEDGELRRLVSVLRDSNDAITVQDLGGRFQAWNRGAERMYGYTEAEALDMDTDQLVPPAERTRALDLVRQIRTGKPVDSVEIQRVRKDGHTLDVWLTITKLLDDHENVVGFATTERDITALRAAEKERRETHERSQELARLQEVNRFKTQFINMAAHELRTPLMPLRTQVHLMINNPAAPPAESQRQALDVMERNLDRLGNLVEDLLTVARSQAGRLGIIPRSIDLGQVIIEAAESYQAVAKAQGIALTVPRDAAVAIVADPERISQVLGNLLSNAIKFTPPGGRVGVAVEDAGLSVRIRVTDSGMGIARRDLPRLFSPFVQVHDTTQVTARGSGLGLYICKQFIEMHGGTVGAESPGLAKGSTFWFTLPKGPIQPTLPIGPGAPMSAWTEPIPQEMTI